jgi:fermentation-respiration switch protein FrsA (DUF1100 family)
MASLSVQDRRSTSRRRTRQALVLLFLLIVCAYAAAIVTLMMRETTIIFRTDVARADLRPAFPFEQVDLPRPDGARQFAWVMRTGSGLKAQGSGEKGIGADESSGVWVLFLHGNASTIASRMNVAHYTRLRELGLSVLAPEYRGYYGLAGTPSERGVASDARAAYEYVRHQLRVPPDRLVIFGWSLGAAVAVDLASQVQARAVILEGAPASIVDIGANRYPFFPVRWFMHNPFNAIDKVSAIRAPLLFLHSPEDDVIPLTEGRRLFDAAPSPKKLVEVRGGHIEASEIDHAVFYGAVSELLAPR